MNDFIASRLLSNNGVFFPRSKSYGSVEISNYCTLFPNEKKSLKKSRESFQEQINEDITTVISTIVSAEDYFEAWEYAEVKFEQVLDSFYAETVVSEIALLKSGYIRDINESDIHPVLSGSYKELNTAYALQRNPLPRIDRSQYIMAIKDSELKVALQRSYHWSRRGKNEADMHLRCLYLWFAVECVARVGTEDISGKIMQAMGFPSGQIGKYISAELLSALKDTLNYKLTEKNTKDKIDSIRKLRNDTVHEGFRSWDIPKETLKEFLSILYMAVPRMQKLILIGLTEKIHTVKELWEYFPVLFENNINIEDFHQTVIYSLKNDENIFNYRSIKI